MPRQPGLTFLSSLFLLLVVGCESPTAAPPATQRHVSAVSSDRSERSTEKIAATQPASEKPAQPQPEISKPAAEKPAENPKVANRVGAAPAGKTAKRVVKKGPAGPPAMPPVLLSQQHQKSCKVAVGDTFPELELADTSGKNRKLSSEYGKKLTVVSFFSGKLASEEQELADLTPEVSNHFGKDGVAVIGVAVSAKPDALADLLKRTGATFPVFVDSDGKAYKTVASDFLPRTYLLDASGKILWLDLEYSATTRRQLNQAIRHVLETK